MSGTYLPLKTLLETKRELRTHIIAVARMSEKPVQIRGAGNYSLFLFSPYRNQFA